MKVTLHPTYYAYTYSYYGKKKIKKHLFYFKICAYSETFFVYCTDKENNDHCFELWKK